MKQNLDCPIVHSLMAVAKVGELGMAIFLNIVEFLYITITITCMGSGFKVFPRCVWDLFKSFEDKYELQRNHVRFGKIGDCQTCI